MSKGRHPVPWYRDITLSRKELIVGKVCLRCGELIGEELTLTKNSHLRKRHIECQKKTRREKQLESAHKNKPLKEPEPKYCIECGELIEERKWDRPNVKRCDSCQFKKNREYSNNYHKKDYKTRQKRREAAKRYYKKHIQKEYPPKPCIDCGELLPKHRWNKPHCVRCDKCQLEYNKKRSKIINKTYRRPSREYTVAVTCVRCGEIVPTNSKNKKYCDKCRKVGKVKKKATIPKVSESEKSNIVREHKKKSKVSPLERRGTYDTAGKWRQYPTEHLVRKKDGTPDFEKEKELVGYLKKKTLSYKKYGDKYNITEGDMIRGLINETHKRMGLK